MVANTPFAFSAGSKRLPADEYAINRNSSSSPAFMLQRTDGRSAALVVAAVTLGGDHGRSA